ncbi:MAG TPA: hypothetical protein VLX11_07810, partial [Candidatus Acidoferrales bacterium]|nr:hypothetical protein [Candidatus Acidoferrales bacterium]
SFFPGNSLTARGINAGDQNKITIGESCHPQGELKGSQFFLVNADSLGEKTFFRNHFWWSIT